MQDWILGELEAALGAAKIEHTACVAAFRGFGWFPGEIYEGSFRANIGPARYIVKIQRANRIVFTYPESPRANRRWQPPPEDSEGVVEVSFSFALAPDGESPKFGEFREFALLEGKCLEYRLCEAGRIADAILGRQTPEPAVREVRYSVPVGESDPLIWPVKKGRVKPSLMGGRQMQAPNERFPLAARLRIVAND